MRKRGEAKSNRTRAISRQERQTQPSEQAEYDEGALEHLTISDEVLERARTTRRKPLEARKISLLQPVKAFF